MRAVGKAGFLEGARVKAAAGKLTAAKAGIVHGALFERDVAQRALDQVDADHAAVQELAAEEAGSAEVSAGKVAAFENAVQKLAFALRCGEVTADKLAGIGVQGLCGRLQGVK